MYKIFFAVPHQTMAVIAERTWEIHERYYRKFPDVYYGRDFQCRIYTSPFWEDVVKACSGYDVILSRGSIAMMLKRNFVDLPTVEVPITTKNLEDAIELSTSKFGRRAIGVIGTSNMLAMVDLVREKLDIPINQYVIDPFEGDYRTERFDIAIHTAISDGCEILIGGNITERKCRERMLNFQRLESSEETIWQAITEAKRTAVIYNEERRKAMTFRTIVDYAHEGVISLDMKGNISLMNNKSAEILGVDRESSLGKAAREVIRGNESSFFWDKQQYINTLVRYDNIRINLNKVNLMMDDEQIGSVITFQDVTSITEMERLVRSKMNKRGHTARYTFDDVKGESQAITEIIKVARLYAKADSNVVLYGESGTGKEVFAQAIHNSSGRKERPFVAINCAAIPENLLESELFGYVEGAFTGANKGGKQGLFEQAHKGTIFLDEICDIPLKLQGRLLRVIQEQEIMRIGDDRIIPIDVRVICATNKELARLVEEGVFREDLFYRLNVLNISIPPLRNRGRDILVLFQHFLTSFAAQAGKAIPQLDAGAERIVLSHQWKGNIRELRNICERLAVFSEYEIVGSREMSRIMGLEKAEDGGLQNAPGGLRRPAETEVKEGVGGFPLSGGKRACGKQLKDLAAVESEQIRRALALTGYNRTEAAKLLGISRTTLWKRLKALEEK